ncbi:MAG: agmatine deiminase family protein [Syntrophomonadaceae bacterium]|nr:agmatine deiminase family protein [Syntrophomonadaceae bacterium]
MYPRDMGYRMPAEWSLHQRTFISWPVQATMCYPQDYEQVCRGYAAIIRAVAEFEPVTVVVRPDDRDTASRHVYGERVEFLVADHDDAWLRDNGPTFIVDHRGGVAGINWRFNAWGEKYPVWDKDDRLAALILDTIKVPRFDAPLVMEGGSIHVDGEGTMLTTEECLLNPNRNPQLERGRIEEYLSLYLGIDKVIWLKRGLSGDETDGHIDNLACWAGPGRVLLQVCDDPKDYNYLVTAESREILRQASDALGRSLEVIEILQPPPRYHEGRRLTLSYLNFYFVNGGIILPVFGGEARSTDIEAGRILSRTFPGRRVRTVDGRAIAKEGGNVHCMTQQMPAEPGNWSQPGMLRRQ